MLREQTSQKLYQDTVGSSQDEAKWKNEEEEEDQNMLTEQMQVTVEGWVYSESSVCRPRHKGRKSGPRDCSQVEDDFKEAVVMDWCEDDEMMKQWEDVSNEEEEIAVRNMEGKRSQVEWCKKHWSFKSGV